MIDFYQNHQVDNTICSLQTSHKIAPLLFRPLLYSKVVLHFLNTFHFHYFELIVSEYIQFCKSVAENKNCFATNRKIGGKTSFLFSIGLKLDDKLQTQKPF